MSGNKPLVLVRGGGDLASGVILRLHRAGLKVVVCELPQPLAVRRSVAFAEAVYEGLQTVEGLTARRAEPDRVQSTLDAGEVPVLVDPGADILLSPLHFPVVIDARITKQPPAPLPVEVSLHIGLGPGFHAGVNCHAVIETRRSHTLGRVYWHGPAQADSGLPEGDPRRVLRAPVEGVLVGYKKIGEHCEEGDLIAVIEPQTGSPGLNVLSPLRGVLRGLLRDGVRVTEGLKIGDVDPRDDPGACFLVSDKSLAIGGGALEAILTRVDMRRILCPTAPVDPPGSQE